MKLTVRTLKKLIREAVDDAMQNKSSAGAGYRYRAMGFPVDDELLDVFGKFPPAPEEIDQRNQAVWFAAALPEGDSGSGTLFYGTEGWVGSGGHPTPGADRYSSRAEAQAAAEYAGRTDPPEEL